MRKSFILAVIFALTTSPCFASSKETIRLLDLFGDVFEKIKRDYVEDVEDKTLVESAINGMLTSLDPHSSYLNEKAYNEMRIQTSGEFGGLGIEVTMENGLVKVVSPIDDTPAHHAGIKAGDYISRIDDEAVMGMALSDAVERMRGKPNTKIVLTVLREGESEPLTFTLTRAVIKIKSVRIKQEEDVAYVRVTSFSEETSKSLQKELTRTIKDIGDNFKGAVLDLRNNPGGLLDQAISVSDLFLDQGEIVSTKGRIADSNKRFNSSRGDILEGKPIVILINGGSASASEIVAGALQDHKRAVVIGTKSFGKGSVQTVVPLSASDGAMRLTTSRYYTPSGRSIQAEGIVPDITVNQGKLESLTGPNMTAEANLRRHLQNGNATATKEKNKEDVKEGGEDSANNDASKEKDKDGGTIDLRKRIEESQKTLYETDYQLAYAVDLLRGIAIAKQK